MESVPNQEGKRKTNSIRLQLNEEKSEAEASDITMPALDQLCAYPQWVIWKATVGNPR